MLDMLRSHFQYSEMSGILNQSRPNISVTLLFKNQTMANRNQVLYKPQIGRPLLSNCVEKTETKCSCTLLCVSYTFSFSLNSIILLDILSEVFLTLRTIPLITMTLYKIVGFALFFFRDLTPFASPQLVPPFKISSKQI